MGTSIVPTTALLTLVGLLGGAGVAGGQAALVIETVPVGNAGNAGESQSQGVFGAVDYDFAIGRYEVTAGEYTHFLNAVAAIADPHALYNAKMWTHAEGCGIERSGSEGSWVYAVAPDRADRPVNFVSWADAVRFANWLHNGQPSGGQVAATTEDGAYAIAGISENSDGDLEEVTRQPEALWAIPSEDEWYKAAYHQNDGVTGHYWSYPTSSDSAPSHELVDPDPGNHATFSGGTFGDWTIGAPHYRTEVGAHENSASPYGTFDQGGNVMEFTEGVPEPDIRAIRGGSWLWGGLLGASERDDVMHSSDQLSDLGFRVVSLPEPAATPLLASGVAALRLLRGRRARRAHPRVR